MRAVRLFHAGELEKRAVALSQPPRAPARSAAGRSPLHETQQAFDAVAARYGESNDDNPLLRAMRERVHETVRRYVPSGAHLLDLGCGPGADEEALAQAGYQVTAIDWSPAMVHAARERIRQAGLEGRVDVRQLGIHQVDRLAEHAFDAVCSNFGPLNCVPDLAAAARGLATRLRPRGVMVASVIGRICPWELALFLSRGDWPRLQIRFARGLVAVPLEGQRVWTQYYTPAAFVRPFAKAGFSLVGVRALGLLTPPPYMQTFAARHPTLVKRLQAVEDRIGSWPGVRQCGDHFLMVLRKA
jgi:SAM-dependent methyltransferase